MSRTVVIIFALLLVSSAALADEGQWMPQQIHDLDHAMLKSRGLELTPDQLWKDNGASGLLRGVVNVRGCSGAFLSKDGLVSTNHHCAYGAIQAQSSADNDLLQKGFFAKDKQAEIAAPGLWVRVIDRITDVTQEVRAKVDAAQTPYDKAKAEEAIRKSLVAQCEDGRPNHRCQVARFYRGSMFQLVDTIELKDIRLVFAPPSGLGNFGGEVDNWMWPRHSIDFTLLRAYVAKDGTPAEFSDDNVPYVPDTFLKVSGAGVSEGDFVSTIGYPGHTDRYLAAAEVQRQVEQVLPMLVDVYGELIDLMQGFSAQDDQKRIKVAAMMRSLMNRHKNARGMLEGIARMKLLKRRQQEHGEMVKLAGTKGGALAKAPDDMNALAAQRRALHERHFLLGTLYRGPNSLAAALRILRWAREGEKPDAERVEGYQDRNKVLLRRRIERNVRDFDKDVDAALLDALLKRLRALPEDMRIAGLDGLTGADIANVAVMNDSTLALFEARDPGLLDKLSSKPLYKLAYALLPVIEEDEKKQDELHGAMLDIGPQFFTLLKEVRKGPIYPDANRTLRFSHAQVRNYVPQDGLLATPQTTFAGQLLKHTGTEPFDLPQNVRAAAAKASASRFADADLHDLPACFLSSSDTTGGNSGSPVVNGKGELVGFNFDRVWENIAGDFGYHISRSRNISVDVRYVLWLLDDVYDGKGLLAEMGLADFKGSARKAANKTANDTAAKTADAKPSPTKGVWVVTFIMVIVGIGLLISGRRQDDPIA